MLNPDAAGDRRVYYYNSESDGAAAATVAALTSAAAAASAATALLWGPRRNPAPPGHTKQTPPGEVATAAAPLEAQRGRPTSKH